MHTSSLSILKSAHTFLSDPNHWTKESLITSNPKSDCGYCCCLEGALLIADGAKPSDPSLGFPIHTPSEGLARARAHLTRTIRRKRNHPFESIVGFNDDFSTTHAQVLSVLDEAIATLESPPCVQPS